MSQAGHSTDKRAKLILTAACPRRGSGIDSKARSRNAFWLRKVCLAQAWSRFCPFGQWASHDVDVHLGRDTSSLSSSDLDYGCVSWHC